MVNVSVPQNPTILVTGGAGYIGSHVSKLLKFHGFQPVVFDNFSQGHRDFVKWGPFVDGDINSRQMLKNAFQTFKPLAVMHLAGLTNVADSVLNPQEYYRNNVAGTLVLLETMLEENVRFLVFSSSCSIFGNPQTIPIPESHPQFPISPYGATKMHVERMLKDFSSAEKINFISLRYFNAAGSDPDGDIGELHNPETHLIPLILDNALGRRDFIQIFGDKHNTRDGTCVRDYIHVCDLANAHLLAMNFLFTGENSQAFNIGTGKGFSIKEVVEATERVTGAKIRVTIGSKREGDPECLIADPSFAQATLGWNPKLSDLETMIFHSWEFRKTFFSRK